MLSIFLKEYLSIIIFLFVALFLSVGFIFLNFLFSPKNPDPEKLSAYECGFEAFNDSRMEFDVRFYLVAILFIIFDLEIAFLFRAAVLNRHHRQSLDAKHQQPATHKGRGLTGGKA